MFPDNALVACQGIEGAYSQIACSRLFYKSKRNYYNSFEGVFKAIESGECQYGVLPIENSTAGSVNRVYDLLMRYDCYIVRSIRLKIEHNLLTKEKISKNEIREIISHEQAISQCEEYLKQFPNAKITVCENTAIAARYVMESEKNDIAALSSIECADIYGLYVVEKSVQDKDNNFTRFICISQNDEIYENNNITSLMLILPHVPGALYHILEVFYNNNFNLVKLESRPIRERDSEYMFYFDIEAGTDDRNLKPALEKIELLCERLRYLGSYKEVS